MCIRDRVRARRFKRERRHGDRRERHLDRVPGVVDVGVLGHSDEGRVHGAEVIDLRAGDARRDADGPFLTFVSFRNERNVKPRT